MSHDMTHIFGDSLFIVTRSSNDSYYDSHFAMTCTLL